MKVRPEPAGVRAGSGGTAMKWPLVGSAAGHLALLAFLLLFLRAAGPGFPVAVQVILVEGARASGSAEERSAAGVPGGARRSPAIRIEPGPVSPPPPVPGTSLPAPQAAPEGRAPAAANPIPAGGPLLLPARVAVGTSSEGLPGGRGFTGAVPPLARSGKGEDPGVFGPSGSAREAALALPGVAGKIDGGEGPEIRLLRERIESRIVYPEEAIRRGQEGEVLLRIRVGEGGIPGEIRIARSSGARSLDEAARIGVARAAPLPSRPGWFEVPVRFFLR
ncbi:MAG: energy transducer TonB [Deltaproteobacteria bacterium]|nr:energy transducer TonB [Deltaproteobacteria bacterium]